MRTKWLLIILLPPSLAMNCDMSTAGNMFPSNANDNSSSGGDMATLTLRITGPVDGEFARVYGIVNDGPQTHADLENRVPQSDFNLTLGQSVGTGMIERSYAYPNGTQIALVAVESDGFIAPGGPPDQIVSRPMEFFGWKGDYQGGETGPNAATLYFTLNGDRTIEAEFVAMRAIVVKAQGGGPHSNVVINVDVNRYIIPPRPIEESGVRADDIPDDNVLWGYERHGAILKLQLMDYIDNDAPSCDDPSFGGPCWVFQTWQGDCAGQGKICNLTFGTANEATVILLDRNAP